MRPDHVLPLPSTPGPNLRNTLANPPVNTSPAIFNTPSKLEHFLQEAKQNGIPGVGSFHPMLMEKGYGPDIMHIISISDLVTIGMAPGDAIRLREYASRWWTEEHRCVAKRPRETGISSTSARALLPTSELTPPSKRLHFEKRYNDGGAMTIYGPAVKSGGWDDDADYMWWVYSKEMSMYVPLPMGKVPVLND